MYDIIVEERIPLKQGLKHENTFKVDAATGQVEERIPLKQGLKPIFRMDPNTFCINLRREFH